MTNSERVVAVCQRVKAAGMNMGPQSVHSAGLTLDEVIREIATNLEAMEANYLGQLPNPVS